MIKVEKISKQYGDINAVNNISLEIKSGEIIGFLGPNGAGKSTLMKIITNQILPTSGLVTIYGTNVIEYKELYHKIGIVFELPNLYVKSSIYNNLILFSKIYKLSESRVNEVMELLQLTERKNTKVETLSKGWRQRVLIARALLHNPEILILDEPTSGLDPNTMTLIHTIIKKLNKNGVTIIITTHNMHEADILCDRVAIIDSGSVKEIGEPTFLKLKYHNNLLKIEYFDTNNKIKTEICENNQDTRNKIQELIENDKMITIEKNDFSLGNVFQKVTGGDLS